MWHAIYDKNTGRLHSLGTVVSDILDNKYAVKQFAQKPSDDDMWDETSRGFVPRPPKVLVDRLEDIKTDPDFGPIWRALKPAQKAAVRQFMIRFLGRQRFRNQGSEKGIG